MEVYAGPGYRIEEPSDTPVPTRWWQRPLYRLDGPLRVRIWSHGSYESYEVPAHLPLRGRW